MNIQEDKTVKERCRVISLDVDVCGPDSAIAEIFSLARSGKGGYVCLASAHMVMEANDDPTFANTVNSASIVLGDGMPVVWMQKLLGYRKAARVRGNDLTTMVCERAGESGLSIGFYGGRSDVVEAMSKRALLENPSLEIAYAYSPPFRELSKEEDDRIVAELASSSPDLLFVGLGCPKQENWMYEHRDRLDCVMLGVGASFDFYSGQISEPPRWIGNIGLEWLYRLMQEPRRLWRRYLILNPRFIALAISQLVHTKRHRRSDDSF